MQAGATGWKLARGTLLVWLVAGGQVLSFDALREFALRAHIIHAGFWVFDEHQLAGVFALIIDALVWVGILGIKLQRDDVQAWVALAVGLAFTLGFQMFLPGEPITLAGTAGRAVPPLALAVGIVVLEVGQPLPATAQRGRTREAASSAASPPSRDTSDQSRAPVSTAQRERRPRGNDPVVVAEVTRLLQETEQTRAQIHAAVPGASYKLIDETRRSLNGSHA